MVGWTGYTTAMRVQTFDTRAAAVTLSGSLSCNTYVRFIFAVTL